MRQRRVNILLTFVLRQRILSSNRICRVIDIFKKFFVHFVLTMRNVNRKTNFFIIVNFIHHNYFSFVENFRILKIQFVKTIAFDRNNVAFAFVFFEFVNIVSFVYKNDSIFDFCDRMIFETFN